MAKKTGIVRIKKEWCKGCELCVHFCPTKVLGMHEFKAHVDVPEKCIGCLMCELRCPDFAIQVQVVENDIETSDIDIQKVTK